MNGGWGLKACNQQSSERGTIDTFCLYADGWRGESRPGRDQGRDQRLS